MANIKTWLASAALVGGAGGGGALGLAAVSDPAGTAAAPAAAPAPQPIGQQELQQRIATLMADERALERAVRTARVRLAGRVAASEHSLAVLQRRLVTAQVALMRVQAARNALLAAPAAQPATAPAAQPISHVTTGASGATPGGYSDDGGGGDD